MPEVGRFEGALVEKDLGYGRTVRMAVDAETGEVLVEQYLCDVARVFAKGANAAMKTLTVSREVTPHGATLLTFTDYEDECHPKLLGRAWVGMKAKRRAALKRARVAHGWLLDAAPKLDDASLGALVRLAAHADAKTRALPSLAELAKATGYGAKTLTRRLASLEQAGVLTRDEEGRYVLAAKAGGER